MERQTIKQLQIIRDIKPNADWAALTKERIMDSHRFEQVENTGVFAWLGNWENSLRLMFGRHAVAVSVLSLAVIFLTSGIMFLNYQNKSLKEIIVQINLGTNSSEKLAASLDEIKNSLEGLNVSLENLKTTKDQGQVLAMTEVVKATAQKGTEMAENVKKVGAGVSDKVLASVQALEQTSKDLTEKSGLVQKELLENYIQDLKQRSLSQEDADRLKAAEEYYNQGRTAEAFVLIMRIGAR